MQNNPDFIQLVHDLKAIGVKEGDSVLVHSSFKSMGHIAGGIATLVAAFREVLGESGTLIVPTLTYSYVSVENPVFDYVNTPSCVGAFSEYVRKLPDAIRSVHPPIPARPSAAVPKSLPATIIWTTLPLASIRLFISCKKRVVRS